MASSSSFVPPPPPPGAPFTPPSDGSFTMGVNLSSSSNPVVHSGRNIRVLSSADTRVDAALPQATVPAFSPEMAALATVVAMCQQASTNLLFLSREDRLSLKVKSLEEARKRSQVIHRAVVYEYQKQKAQLAAMERRVTDLTGTNKALVQQEATLLKMIAELRAEKENLIKINTGFAFKIEAAALGTLATLNRQ